MVAKPEHYRQAAQDLRERASLSTIPHEKEHILAIAKPADFMARRHEKRQAAHFAMSTTEKPEDAPQIRPHAARLCSDLATLLLRAQAENDQAQAQLDFDAFDLPLFQAAGRRGR